jgi:hypothetical protein
MRRKSSREKAGHSGEHSLLIRTNNFPPFHMVTEEASERKKKKAEKESKREKSISSHSTERERESESLCSTHIEYYIRKGR